MSEFLKPLKIIHISLFMGQLSFAVVLLVLQLAPFVEDAEMKKNLLQVMAVVFFLSVLGGRYLFRYMRGGLPKIASLEGRQEKYRKALLLRWSSLEFSSLFALTCFLLTAEKAFLVFAGLTAVLLLAEMPSQTRFNRDLGV